MKIESIMRYALFIILWSVLLLNVSPLAQESARPNTSFEELQKGFYKPDMIYAPFGFWFGMQD
jgi:hypothetical protein